MQSATQDESTERLAQLFAEHPAWVEAAQHLDVSACSTVYFTHLEGEAWRLVRYTDGTTRLEPGAAADPDLVFRFSPESIDALAGVEGGVGEFAVALFEQIIDDAVDLRIRVGFVRLGRRGYVRLLLAAGPSVIAFGARHGIRTLGALRKFVADLRASGRADWES